MKRLEEKAERDSPTCLVWFMADYGGLLPRSEFVGVDPLPQKALYVSITRRQERGFVERLRSFPARPPDRAGRTAANRPRADTSEPSGREGGTGAPYPRGA